ncbi:MAG TPA: alpha/beta hydrolase [Candidatus Angelobacter sp.]|jgi:acetyl esterase
MQYADGIQEFIDRCNKAMPPNFYTFPLAEQRELYFGLTREFPYALPEDVTITDETVSHEGQELRLRVYRPAKPQGRGLLIYIRGGGFVVGSLATHNTVVAELASRSGLTAIAPDFRLAPEYPFPSALEDCYGVLCAVAADENRFGIDSSRIVVCGDSSGANMAVVVSMMTRDRNGPALAGQALISPVLDFTRWQHGGEDAPLLLGDEMAYYTACYCPPELKQVSDPYVSPLVSGKFHDLPSAYIVGGELDSLLVDSVRYAELLQANGTPAELVVEKGLPHSAMRARGLSKQVARAWEQYCNKAGQLTELKERAYAGQ